MYNHIIYSGLLFEVQSLNDWHIVMFSVEGMSLCI